MTGTASRNQGVETATSVEDRREQQEERPLMVSEEGLALLRDRLRIANLANPAFKTHVELLFVVLRRALDDFRCHFSDQIERVLASGPWALNGIDLRTLPDAEDAVLTVVVRTEERVLALDMRLSESVFEHFAAGRYPLYLEVLPLPQWTHALEHVRASGRTTAVLGIPLLVRA